MINFDKVTKKSFANGNVYLAYTHDGYPVEFTDTFLPYYTKDAIGRKQNTLINNDLGDRSERWMIGVSCMSGCPVRCKFCGTGKLKKWRNLTADEIRSQICYVRNQNLDYDFFKAKEPKINYTRMGEPFLNIEEVKKAIRGMDLLASLFGATIHHYISTIGIKGADYSWIKDNITLQISLHSLDNERRNDLIPYKNKVTIKELGEIRTDSNLKTSINMTLVDEQDFDIEKMKKHFTSEHFFVKLSPINKNTISEKNKMGDGIVKGINIVQKGQIK